MLTGYLDLEVVLKQPLEVLECLRSVGSHRHVSWDGFKLLVSLSLTLILTVGEVVLSAECKTGWQISENIQPCFVDAASNRNHVLIPILRDK